MNCGIRPSQLGQNEQNEGVLEDLDSGEGRRLERRINKDLLDAEKLQLDDRLENAIIKLRLVLQKINFLKQHEKPYDLRLEIVCVYNLAAVFHKQWNLHDCIPLLEKFITMLRGELDKNQSQPFSTGQLCEEETRWFKMQSILVKSLLQYCAVLSQIGNHAKALLAAMETTLEIKKLFQRASEQCGIFLRKREPKKAERAIVNVHSSEYQCSTPRMLRHDNSYNEIRDKIQFSNSVMSQANFILRDLAKMQTYEEIIEIKLEGIESQMKEIKEKTYFWKNNPENNVKLLRREFMSTETEAQPNLWRENTDRNILGIKRNESWLEQFTITKIMFMTPLHYLQLNDKDNFVFEFNQRNLLEKIIFLAVSYFSIAIELRFIEEGKRQEDALSNNEKQPNSRMQRSEIFHLKAIEILCKYIKENSAIVNHLVSNYHKHYKSNLNIIQEENSMAQYSTLYDPKGSLIKHPSELGKILEEKEDQDKNSSYFQKDSQFLIPNQHHSYKRGDRQIVKESQDKSSKNIEVYVPKTQEKRVKALKSNIKKEKIGSYFELEDKEGDYSKLNSMKSMDAIRLSSQRKEKSRVLSISSKNKTKERGKEKEKDNERENEKERKNVYRANIEGAKVSEPKKQSQTKKALDIFKKQTYQQKTLNSDYQLEESSKLNLGSHSNSRSKMKIKMG